MPRNLSAHDDGPTSRVATYRQRDTNEEGLAGPSAPMESSGVATANPPTASHLGGISLHPGQPGSGGIGGIVTQVPFTSGSSIGERVTFISSNGGVGGLAIPNALPQKRTFVYVPGGHSGFSIPGELLLAPERQLNPHLYGPHVSPAVRADVDELARLVAYWRDEESTTNETPAVPVPTEQDQENIPPQQTLQTQRPHVNLHQRSLRMQQLQFVRERRRGERRRGEWVNPRFL